MFHLKTKIANRTKYPKIFQYGSNAASLTIAELYVAAFGKLAKNTNTLILPSNTGDITHMVSQVI